MKMSHYRQCQHFVARRRRLHQQGLGEAPRPIRLAPPRSPPPAPFVPLTAPSPEPDHPQAWVTRLQDLVEGEGDEESRGDPSRVPPSLDPAVAAFREQQQSAVAAAAREAEQLTHAVLALALTTAR